MSPRRAVFRRHIPEDLREIIRYFAEREPGIADRFIDSFWNAVPEIAAHPGRGSPKDLPNLARQIRSWPVPGFRDYLILYELHDEAVVLLAVSHGSRDLDRLLGQRGDGVNE